MLRYQVKVPTRQWDDEGPDLLRRKPTAVSTAISHLMVKQGWWSRKRKLDGSWWDWVFIGDKLAVERYLFSQLPNLNDNQIVQLGQRQPDKKTWAVKVQVRCANIPVAGIANATVAVEETNALFHRRFPACDFAGAYACKRENGDPDAPWSDHAWGDALDESQDADEGAPNDAMTDWAIRMAREGELQAELILGSQNGHVINASTPHFEVNFGGSSSHLWHVHVSCHRHDGVPPCAQ